MCEAESDAEGLGANARGIGGMPTAWPRRALAWVVAGLAIGLASCSEQGIRDELAEEGRPPDYVDGYMDGCKTGLSRAGDERYTYLKDAARYRMDPVYQQGWDRGVEECAKGQRRLQGLIDETSY